MDVQIQLDTSRVIEEIRKGIRPKETCGVISTTYCVYPITNVSDRPNTFVMHKIEYLKILNLLKSKGEEVLLIYHTHPFGPATPSVKDIEYYNKSPYGMLIVSLKDHYLCLD